MDLREREAFHILYFVFGFANSFILDTRNFTIYNGPEDSYFGYSVGLLKNSEGFW
jgi:hypothetical protein